MWWAQLSAPWGRRPVVLLSRDEAYDRLTWIIVAPITTALRRAPSIVPLTVERDGVTQSCVVTLDNLQVARPAWLVDGPITRLSADRMRQLELAMHFAMSIENCPA